MIMKTPPLVAFGRAYNQWVDVGASTWIFHQLRFCIKLSWRSTLGRKRRITKYPLAVEDLTFAENELGRWLGAGFIRRASGAEVKEIMRQGCVSPGFVSTSAGRQRIVVYYKKINEHWEDQTCRMEHLTDIALMVRRNKCLFKGDLKEGYYHLLLRTED